MGISFMFTYFHLVPVGRYLLRDWRYRCERDLSVENIVQIILFSFSIAAAVPVLCVVCVAISGVFVVCVSGYVKMNTG